MEFTHEFTKELTEKAKTAKNAEELAEMAKAEGIEMTAEEAEKVYAELNKRGELADEELDNVAGGGCRKASYPSPSGDCSNAESVTFLYKVGQEEEVYCSKVINTKTKRCKILAREVRYEQNGYGEYVYRPCYYCQSIDDPKDVDWYPQVKIENP